MQDGGLQIVDMHLAFGHAESQFIRGPMNVAAFETCSRHPDREATGMMVASVIGLGKLSLRVDRPSEFTAPNHQRVLEQPALLQIGDQRVAFLIHPPYEVENSPERVLTHWPTGARIGSLTPVKLRLSRSGAARVTDRDAAKELIEALIRHYTAEVLIERFASLPVINP